MAENPTERHQHSGKSSREYLDADSVLRETGLKAGDVFLDLGSGEGYFSIAAAPVVGSGGRVYAVDNDARSIELLREHLRGANIGNVVPIVADVSQKLPLDDAAVDVCLMANVLHGFAVNAEVESTMLEVARVMKKGGTLAVVDFKKRDGTPGPPLAIRLTPAEVEGSVVRYGFAKTRVADVGPYHYAVMFSAKPETAGPRPS